MTHLGGVFRNKTFSKTSGLKLIKKAKQYLPLQKFFEKQTKKDTGIYMPNTPLGYIRDSNFFKRNVKEMKITTGGVQLIVARFLNLKKQRRTSEEINDELAVLYNKISYLEQILEGTPTFGAEFSFNGITVKKTNPEYNFFKAKELANELLVLGGNSGNGIRPCDESTFTTMEFRINPSYAPITIALIKEMFELEIFPSEELSWYLVNMVGEKVLENGIPLILTNYYTGLTPNLELGAGENLDDVLDFKDVHVYQGATVDVKTGELLIGTKQLNIFAGVTGKIKKNAELFEYKEILEEDPKERMLRMLLPFLINEEYRNLWRENIYQIFELSQSGKTMLQRRFDKAEFDSNIWKTNNDIKVKDSAVIREGLHNLYSNMIELVQTEKPEIYNALFNIKL
ncbi:hypothetical protein COV11_01510 [Candidatus Woesearchaeota archaeon CG10_big_fil_rev_8_21_14_0_10_30_7]|nr:MAG: hypothetical protein COV11_01510 [Candidatus Woesearchaeota archaeon CG10_big_fil_rev_8_21_14_0_10_30_7]